MVLLADSKRTACKELRNSRFHSQIRHEMLSEIQGCIIIEATDVHRSVVHPYKTLLASSISGPVVEQFLLDLPPLSSQLGPAHSCSERFSVVLVVLSDVTNVPDDSSRSHDQAFFVIFFFVPMKCSMTRNSHHAMVHLIQTRIGEKIAPEGSIGNPIKSSSL